MSNLIGVANGISKRMMCTELKDLTNVKWSYTKDSPGTAGMFLKGRVTLGGKEYFLKMSSYNAVDGVYGRESFLELIASNLAEVLGFEHIPYELWYARIKVDDSVFNTWISASVDYRKPNEYRLSLDAFYQMNKEEGESLTDFVMRSEFKHKILEMLIFDYIIYNRDRHSNNIEILYSSSTNSYRLVPIFDNGCCLSAPLFDKWYTMDKDYYLQDKPVNNCIGSKSLKENLNLVKENGIRLKPVSITDDIFEEIDTVIGHTFWYKHLDMIKERYEYAMDFLNQR